MAHILVVDDGVLVGFVVRVQDCVVSSATSGLRREALASRAVAL